MSEPFDGDAIDLDAFSFDEAGMPIVYICAVPAGELPDFVTRQVEAETKGPINPNAVFYALRNDDGQTIALFDSKDIAVFAAKSHNLAPLSVH
jgi:hypothetical protein